MSEWKAADGVRLFAQAWLPETSLRGVVALVHGLGEHSSRYEHVAERLAASGYVTQSCDLHGHGKSGGRRAYASYELLFTDIDLLLQAASTRAGALPVFLYGHSMGGSVVLCYLLERGPALAGAVVSSPGLSPAQPTPPLKLALGRLMARIAPAFAMSNGLPKGGASRDPVANRAIDDDPLMHSLVSARLGMDIIGSASFVESRVDRLHTPLLFMQGSADTFVDPGVNMRIAARLPGDVTVKSWDGLYHELHNEPEKAQVLDYVVAWLDRHR